MMHYEHPIEVLVRSSRTRFQSGFARQAARLLPPFERVVLEPSAQGLRVLATDELALATPLEAIRQMHDGDVEIGEPRVRYFEDGAVHEPVMRLRLVALPSFVDPVIEDLVRRSAEVEQVDRTSARAVVKARAPLRALLGYPKALDALTGNTADVAMWLSHYAPVPPEPDNAA